MKIKDIYESATTAGAIAVGSPAKVGKTQKRAGSLFKGKVTKKPFYEAEVNEEEIVEQDLILVPDQIIKKDKSFVPHERDRRDHEVEMARSELFAAAKDAQRIYAMLKNRTEDEGLMGWQQSYITLAADYLNSVADSLDYDAVSNEGAAGKIVSAITKHGAKDLPKTPETQRAIANQAMKIEKNLDRAAKVGTAAVGGAAGKEIYDKSKKANEGVIAGGMSNFEEGRYYDPMGDERREQQAMDDERRDFKRREMEYELRNEPKNNYAVHIDGRSWKVFGDKGHAEAVARKLRMKGKKAEVKITGAPVSEAKAHKCPECGGELVSEEMINEKKDACYYKVKSRYKVWPSAYASGALVKCRKKGASNWGKGKSK